MNKFIISGAILMALTFSAFAANTAPGSGPQAIESDHCISQSDAALIIISQVPDAVGVVKNDHVIVFHAASIPDKDLIITFDDKGCAATTEVVPAHAS